jgi:hypothetical protein
MVVLLWNSLIPAMILDCSAASAQETVQCQFVSEFVPVKTANVLLCIVENTRPGQKVSRLRSKGTVHSHCAAQSRTVTLCQPLRQRPRNAGLLRGKSQRTPALDPNSAGASVTKLPSHCSIRVFTVSCLRHTLRGKAFDDAERSKVTPHSNLYRCTKRTTGGASSSGRSSEISLSKQNGSGSEGIST